MTRSMMRRRPCRSSTMSGASRSWKRSWRWSSSSVRSPRSPTPPRSASATSRTAATASKPRPSRTRSWKRSEARPTASITRGMSTSDITNTARIVTCSTIYRFETCSGPKIVSSSVRSGTTAPWMIPHTGTQTGRQPRRLMGDVRHERRSRREPVRRDGHRVVGRRARSRQGQQPRAARVELLVSERLRERGRPTRSPRRVSRSSTAWRRARRGRTFVVDQPARIRRRPRPSHPLVPVGARRPAAGTGLRPSRRMQPNRRSRSRARWVWTEAAGTDARARATTIRVRRRLPPGERP